MTNVKPFILVIFFGFNHIIWSIHHFWGLIIRHDLFRSSNYVVLGGTRTWANSETSDTGSDSDMSSDTGSDISSDL